MKTYYNILQHVAHTREVVYPKSDHFEDTMKFWTEVNMSRQSQDNIILYTFILTTFRESIIPDPESDSNRSSTMSLDKFIKIKHIKINEYLETANAPWVCSNYHLILDILSVAQKHYNAFAKLANIYRYKKNFLFNRRKKKNKKFIERKKNYF